MMFQVEFKALPAAMLLIDLKVEIRDPTLYNTKSQVFT